MMVFNVYFLLFLILNVLGALLFVWAAYRVPASTLKNTLLVLICAIALWNSALMSHRFYDAGPEWAPAHARLIVLTGVVLSIAYIIFLLRLAEDRLNTFLFSLFIVNSLILAALILSGQVIGGVKSTLPIEPIYGPWHGYFVTTLALFPLLYNLRLFMRMRTCESAFMRMQIRYIFWSSMVAFISIVLINGLLPLITGTTPLAIAGPVATMIFIAGVLFVLLRGHRLYITSSMGVVLKHELFQREQNTSALRQLLAHVSMIVHDTPDQFLKHVRFYNGTREVDIFLKHSANGDGSGKLSGRDALPEGWVAGLLDGVRKLEGDNHRMALALARAESLLQSGDIPGLDEAPLSSDKDESDATALVRTGTGRAPLPDVIDFSDYAERLEQNLAEFSGYFGVRLICFSSQLMQCLTRADRLAGGRVPVFLFGEPGCGKALTASAIHRRRGAEELPVTLSAVELDAAELKRAIHSNCTTGADTPRGLMICQAHRLRPDLMPLLGPCFKPDASGYLYLSAPSAQIWRQNLPEECRHYDARVSIGIPPLRERPADLMHLTLYFARLINVGYGQKFTGMHRDIFARIQNQEWPGNITELYNFMQFLFASNRPPIIERWPEELPAITADEHLTPLERSEKKTIEIYLKKNSFVKSHTSRDLGITLNTLKSKIRRYGL
ncbi:MAG: sigma 54-interacting transcriptional regulator [Leptospiraceae bacterium]|nr:sigma 54-interacting transcriptional regulator [Leptospiraceae bacterium]